MTSHACAACAAPIVLTEEQEARLRKSHVDFYCPFGHANNWPAEKLPADEIIQKLSDDVAYWSREHDRVEERLQRVRLKARTCPICDAVFRAHAKLAAHLVYQHGAWWKPTNEGMSPEDRAELQRAIESAKEAS